MLPMMMMVVVVVTMVTTSVVIMMLLLAAIKLRLPTWPCSHDHNSMRPQSLSS